LFQLKEYTMLKLCKVNWRGAAALAVGAVGLNLGVLFGAATAPQGKVEIIEPGGVWKDDRGIQIQAHGGGILLHEGTYYWYGEHRSQTNQRGKKYVSCYASKDLLNWTFKKDVVAWTDPDNIGNFIIERPKVYYNAKTKKFVMYMHIDDGGYKTAEVGIGVCDTADGDFKFVKRFRPLDHESRDIGQFVDDDGTAYLIFEDRPFGFRIARLADDYMSLDKQMCLIPKHMEGGAVVHYDGLYYAIGSNLTSWDPNPNTYATAQSLEGPWSAFKDIAPPATKTYGSQSTLLLKIVGTKTTTVVFMGDQWKARTLWDSRYLWMPVEIGNGKLTLPEPKPWTLDVATGEAVIVKAAATQK
jgi:hypothetical protein